MNNNHKTICDQCGFKTWYETEQPCHRQVYQSTYCDTCGHTETTDKLVKCGGTLRVIDNSSLDARFKRYFENKEGVKVTYKDGTTENFYIGKSTGWKPIYLMIKKSNSSVGGGILSNFVDTIQGLNKFKH